MASIGMLIMLPKRNKRSVSSLDRFDTGRGCWLVSSDLCPYLAPVTAWKEILLH